MTDLARFLLPICRQVTSTNSTRFLLTICCQGMYNPIEEGGISGDGPDPLVSATDSPSGIGSLRNELKLDTRRPDRMLHTSPGPPDQRPRRNTREILVGASPIQPSASSLGNRRRHFLPIIKKK
ncbi:PREDICTED: uncharacterized protein LOC108756685 isoform X2 [Trachymyrmex septentrionalis]|uniref:uncharacterized protein LOC108756685 isoform X2 n=1 Tax=Trachymyrmex septentrionalis TaxID=34720 RepID=UPI00084F7193|nr:PREDICTED: uncharacterized protein LOC108756685 isoform X2 [Trachymyrmex septentrionalis]